MCVVLLHLGLFVYFFFICLNALISWSGENKKKTQNLQYRSALPYLINPMYGCRFAFATFKTFFLTKFEFTNVKYFLFNTIKKMQRKHYTDEIGGKRKKGVSPGQHKIQTTQQQKKITIH